MSRVSDYALWVYLTLQNNWLKATIWVIMWFICGFAIVGFIGGLIVGLFGFLLLIAHCILTYPEDDDETSTA